MLLGFGILPDGKRIAFLRHASGISEVMAVPASGGAEQRLGQSAAGWVGLSWAPDGSSLAIADRAGNDESYSLALLSTSGGQKKKLTSPPDRTFGDWHPVFSPDGKMIAFTRTRTFWIGDLYVMPAAGGEPRRLTSDQRLVWGATWTPDGTGIVFSSNRGGKQQLWRVQADGASPPQNLSGAGENAFSPFISPKDKVLAFTRGA